MYKNLVTTNKKLDMRIMSDFSYVITSNFKIK